MTLDVLRIRAEIWEALSSVEGVSSPINRILMEVYHGMINEKSNGAT
jgi:hypothetical protein